MPQVLLYVWWCDDLPKNKGAKEPSKAKCKQASKQARNNEQSKEAKWIMQEHRQLVSSVPDMCVDAEVTRLEIKLVLTLQDLPQAGSDQDQAGEIPWTGGHCNQEEVGSFDMSIAC